MDLASECLVVTMFLPEDVPDGIRIVERSNWVGQASACPIESFAAVKMHTDLRQRVMKGGI